MIWTFPILCLQEIFIRNWKEMSKIVRMLLSGQVFESEDCQHTKCPYCNFHFCNEYIDNPILWFEKLNSNRTKLIRYDWQEEALDADPYFLASSSTCWKYWMAALIWCDMRSIASWMRSSGAMLEAGLSSAMVSVIFFLPNCTYIT